MQGLPHVDSAVFHVFIECPQLSSTDQCTGPPLLLHCPGSPWGLCAYGDQSSQGVMTAGRLCSWNLGKLNQTCWR